MSSDNWVGEDICRVLWGLINNRYIVLEGWARLVDPKFVPGERSFWMYVSNYPKISTP